MKPDLSSPEALAAPPTPGLISLCVGTFRRPDGIVAAARSLLAQEVPAGWRTEVIVVDNDPTGSARAPLQDHLRADERSRIRYVVESTPGVSHMRNRCLDEARGELIAFIDDDETAPSGWLGHMVDALQRHQADAVFGPVEPVYVTPPPAWVTVNGVHHRARRRTGETLAWEAAQTNNVLMRRHLLDGGLRFSALFARTGGEDSFLFGQALQAGRRLVWCDEASVQETVPPVRTTRRWILGRAFHGGRTYVRLRHHLGWRAAYPMLALYGLVYAAVVMLPMLLLTSVGHPRHMHYALKFAGNLGKIAARFYDAGRYGH